MITVPVILITVAGPAGHIDVGVRSDVSPAELAASLQEIIGTRPPWAGGEHRAPPRPGDPRGRRVALRPGVSLADAGVADGDVIVFADPAEHAGPATYTATVTPGHRRPPPPADSLPGPARQLSSGPTGPDGGIAR